MKDNVVNLSDPARAFWMTRSVARAMRVNLSEAIARGQLSTDGYAQLITTCRRCSNVKECELWLATRAVQTGEAPRNCPNRNSLESLR